MPYDKEVHAHAQKLAFFPPDGERRRNPRRANHEEIDGHLAAVAHLPTGRTIWVNDRGVILGGVGRLAAQPFTRAVAGVVLDLKNIGRGRAFNPGSRPKDPPMDVSAIVAEARRRADGVRDAAEAGDVQAWVRYQRDKVVRWRKVLGKRFLAIPATPANWPERKHLHDVVMRDADDARVHLEIISMRLDDVTERFLSETNSRARNPLVEWTDAAGYPRVAEADRFGAMAREGHRLAVRRLSPGYVEMRDRPARRRSNESVATVVAAGMASGFGAALGTMAASKLVGRRANPLPASCLLPARRPNVGMGAAPFIFAIGNEPGRPGRQIRRPNDSGGTYRVKLPADRVLGTMPLEEARRRWPNIGLDVQVEAFQDFNRGSDPHPEVILWDDRRRGVEAGYIAGRVPEMVYGGPAGSPPGSFKDSGGVQGAEPEGTIWVHESPNQWMVGRAERDRDGKPVTRDFQLIGDTRASRGWLRA